MLPPGGAAGTPPVFSLYGDGRPITAVPRGRWCGDRNVAGSSGAFVLVAGPTKPAKVVTPS
jgi:hypothetical protein